MITRIVKLTLTPGFIPEFMDYFNTIKTAIRSSPGCMHLELIRGRNDDRLFFTYSIWNSESDLDHYLNSERFRATWTKVKPMFAAGAEAWSLDRIEEVGADHVR
jgi:hypothetical protein